jgi:transposase
MFEAMVYLLRVECPWRDLPAIFGPWNSVYTRWRRWSQAGLWTKLLRVLARKAHGQLRFLDTSHIKVHQDASNPAGGQQNQAIGRTKGGLNTKLSAWVDGRGRAVRLSLASGPASDVVVAQTSMRPILPATWHRGHYRKRHKVENLFQRLKRHRRIGTRYEKNDLYFLAFVHLAVVLDWLNN